MDPREDPTEDCLAPREETKMVQIGESADQVTYLGVNLDPEEEIEIIKIL